VRTMIERAPLGKALAGNRLFPNVQTAVDSFNDTNQQRTTQ
jgi:hypothetical protein